MIIMRLLRCSTLKRILKCRRLQWYHVVACGLVLILSTCLLFGTSLKFEDLNAFDEFSDPMIEKDVFFSSHFQNMPEYKAPSSNEEPLKGNQRALAAFGTLPERIRLRELQREILANQKRPPDSTYNINVTNSDSVSIDRQIEDTRPPACKLVSYNMSKLSTASIVIPFYNEALSMLLRTIHSILNRTPNQLLQEIVLVDDCSTHEALHNSLDKYVVLLPKVKLFRNKVREGLIRSRLLGAEETSAPIVIFLDAHTEVNQGWIEPLLYQLKLHPNSIVQPFIDGIDVQTMLYSQPRKIHKGGFSWDLRYIWLKVPDYMQESILKEGQPFWSPTLVGCAIAVDRTYFNSIGAFDPDQRIWGGENLELAFRAWLCGGQVVTLPCSRVGHAFRPLPYSADSGWQLAWQKNLMRIADIWMGDYKKYFYSSTRIYSQRRVNYTEEEEASLQNRMQLKRKLQCKGFDWYLANVVPEFPVPSHDAKYHGQLTNYKSHACWDVLADDFLSITYECYEHKILTDSIFTITYDGRLTYKDKCVHFEYPKPHLKLLPCPLKSSQSFGVWNLKFLDNMRWAQVQVTMTMPNGITKEWCIMQVTSAVEPHAWTQMPHATECDDTNHFQVWSFDYRFDYHG